MADVRRPGIRAGAVFLMLAAAGCSGMTARAVGSLTFTTTDGKVLRINNPSVDGCHKLPPPGAKSVVNHTLNDVIVYTGADCHNLKGTEGAYVATQTSNPGASGRPPWQSFTVVGGNA